MKTSMQPPKDVPSSAANLNMLNLPTHQFLIGVPPPPPPPTNIPPIYVSGVSAQRLKEFVHRQQCRPADNNISFWRNFVAEFFAPNGKKKFCFSLYPRLRNPACFFLSDLRTCQACRRNPCNGFELCYEILPRLFKMKYESGLLEENIFLDIPREYRDPSGYIVLFCSKVTRESLFYKVRVVHEGSLRIVFSPCLKIRSLEFCAKRHEVLIYRSYLVPDVNQVSDAVSNFSDFIANNINNNNVSTEEYGECSNNLVASTQELAKKLEVPMLDDNVGFAKSYVRCLQISQIGNNMKDLIDFSMENEIGPIESLARFQNRTGVVDHGEDELQQQNGDHDLNNCDDNNEQTPGVQIGSSRNGTRVTTSTVRIHNSVDYRALNSENNEQNVDIQPQIRSGNRGRGVLD
ncbi:hypothetical protein PIB30_092351 [Stylosanthes scabra]|uniref:Uncharacterized protein n=1 Tax=Stylosanthes scabra TaxID=79078 RepID=A0ABU6WT60_9FABA|nr:hypothetical protein [Stylosanthes scabra]